MRATGVNNLDDFSKAAVYIPFNSDGDDLSDESDREWRVVAYRDAWKKCLSRMQETVLRLQRPSASKIVVEVKSSYMNTLPGLPHPEIPVISIINPAMGSSFLTNITDRLEEDQQSNVIHLYLGDFPNLVTGMRSIISSFVQKTEVPQQVKRKGGSALASYDIKLLAAWYEAWARSLQFRPNLVIVLHDFEQLDPLIMQDVFDICSTQIPQLPIVFLLSMTNPSSNYLNITYPRSTLSLLRVRTFTTPTGQHILNEILLRTFFDLDFQPAIMLGPSTLQFLQEYFSRYHSSVDTIFTIIQLAYMKHFAIESLAVLSSSTPTDVLAHHGLIESLKASFSRQKDRDVDMNDEDSPDALLASVDEARTQFQAALDKKRLSLRTILLVQELLQRQGHSGVNLSTRENKITAVDVMTNVLQGNDKHDFIEKILKVVSGLNAEDLDELLERFYLFLTDVDSHWRYAKLRGDAASMRGNLTQKDGISGFAADVADWVEKIVDEGSMPLESSVLWEAWYTGLSPFPHELLNPSIRASLMAGLLRPFDFQDDFTEKTTTQNGARPIAELPDTSILFKRYLDSGKMINVYDWFESFKSVLDTQYELISTRTLAGASPKKGKGRAKAKSVTTEVARDEDKWNVEVQARFIRALHELDYLGFIKHSGRKADHVQRTVFDIDDPE